MTPGRLYPLGRLTMHGLDRRLDDIQCQLAVLTAAVAGLILRIDSGGLTGPETAAVTAWAKSHAARLEAIARDPLAPHPKETPSMAGPNKAVPPDLTQALADIDAATNAVAATVAGLDSLITTSMTPADVAAVKATLQGVTARLTGIAADPNVPVPPAPPPVVPPAPAP